MGGILKTPLLDNEKVTQRKSEETFSYINHPIKTLRNHQNKKKTFLIIDDGFIRRYNRSPKGRGYYFQQ